jgi:WhiB family redox-sensing transcriptional regulator
MQAKAVCSNCPVIQSCLRWAIAAREPYGVWGGLSAEEREALLTRQPA